MVGDGNPGADGMALSSRDTAEPLLPMETLMNVRSLDRVLSRRRFLEGAAAFSCAMLWRVPLALSAEKDFELPGAASQALAKTPIVYLSPIQSSGEESTCHAEIWFAHAGTDVYVVTPATAWRTRAIEKGLDRARIWVGDHGVWRRNSKFKSAPSYLSKASIVPKGDSAIERGLAIMGEKYASDWAKWGPRFRAGLKDGSRVMLRYQPVGA